MPTFTIISCALAVVYGGGTPGARRLRPGHLVHGRGGSRRSGSRRARGRSCPCTSTATRSTWTPLLELAADSTAWRSSKTPPKRTGRSTCRTGTAHTRRGAGAAASATPSCFSFYANKLITTGEGGMVRDRRRGARRAGAVAAQPVLPAEAAASSTRSSGFNFRLTNLQAALGLAQLERIDEHRRQEAPAWARRTRERLAGFRGCSCRSRSPGRATSTGCTASCCDEETGMDAAAVRAATQRSAEWRRGRSSWACTSSRCCIERGLFARRAYPVAERLARQGLYLPSGLALTEQQLSTVCGAVREVLS